MNKRQRKNRLKKLVAGGRLTGFIDTPGIGRQMFVVVAIRAGQVSLKGDLYTEESLRGAALKRPVYVMGNTEFLSWERLILPVRREPVMKCVFESLRRSE